MIKQEIFYECHSCPSKFDNKEKFIKHLKNQHMETVYTCEECHLKLDTKLDYVDHMTNEHKFSYCSECKIATKPDEVHKCGETIVAFLCDIEGCRDKYYYRLNFFVRHLQVEHRIADFSRIKTLIETKCREIVKPSKLGKKGREAQSSKVIDRNSIDEEFNELIDYAAHAHNRSIHSFTSSESESQEGMAAETNLLRKDLKVEDFNFPNTSSSAPKKRKTPGSLYSKSKILSSMIESKEKQDKDRAKENEYELLMCRYKDNKRFIKSIKYEELLLKALSLSEAIQTQKNIFTVVRYGKPFSNPAYYQLSEFKQEFNVKLCTVARQSREFDDLIEKQWRVRTYSTINHRLFEHKKHSNYMLNKRLRLFCDNCQTQFRFFEEFIKHYRMCLYSSINTIEKFPCPICTLNFFNYFAMIQHLEIEHFIV